MSLPLLPLSMNLLTERLSLERLTLDDHAFIQELVNTAGWLQFIGDRHVHSSEDAQAYIHKISDNPLICYWVVRRRDTATPVGIITFLKRAYLAHFDIGFAFLPAYTGQGYAYEAASQVLSVVRQQPEHAVVQATTVVDNSRSRQLLAKLGLHLERELEVEQQCLLVYTTAPLAPEDE
jgi:ribosomal-protein-alanine N-acetyltransferase